MPRARRCAIVIARKVLDRSQNFSKGDFNQKCRNSFGEGRFENIWFDPRVVAAKAVRHALVHAGGRETDELKKYRHGLLVVNSELQILPNDVDSLFHVLKPRVSEIVEWAATQDEFK